MTRPGVLSPTAIERQRAVNRIVDGLTRERRTRDEPGVAPDLGVAQATLVAGQSGQFTLARNRPDVQTESSQSRTAYALCDIPAQTKCVLIYFVTEASAGYWGALPCTASEAPGVTCSRCADNEGPPIVTVDITLANVDPPTPTTIQPIRDVGVDFATAISGTHAIFMNFCSGLLVLDTGPTVNAVTDAAAGNDTRALLAFNWNEWFSLESGDALETIASLLITLEVKLDDGTWFQLGNLEMNSSGPDYPARIDCYDSHTFLTARSYSLGAIQADISLTSGQVDAYIAPPPPEPTVRTITAATYTAVETDRLLIIDATSNNVTVTLFAADSQEQDLRIKRKDASANTVTIDGDAAETIDGATTQTLPNQYDYLTLRPASGEWWSI